MRKNGHRIIALALFVVASAAQAQAPHGEAQLAGSERLAAKGCGRSGAPLTLDFAIEPLVCIATILPCPDDGAWTLSGAAAPLSGLSHGGPRGARLSLDAQSLAALESALEAKAAEQCGEAVDLTSFTAKGALVLSKRRERARLFVKAKARIAGESGRAIYRVRGRGAWVPVTSQ